ncbi:crotonase/enoyl-CoA hydratase family protein [Micromonospora zingiberis]|uniref:Crotonase/enoyl-CoA hydratase family protein n=1 Tax=Micromonospora zingiberis TaxID=2053011 RepID=A0A4R0GGN3_9ACTN|nr:crotonase/enoyl-CoA hydratase family protein [Micromonospora zingiberis]TCB95472.1 crotonase/enoyl-CoA hydratase family protein [Micromonospora zingiberis]
MVSSEPALLEIRDGVAVVTLNRPEALNAVNAELSRAVGDAVTAAEADPRVHVIVLTGAGRAFCAGADLKAIGAGLPLHHPGHPEWGFAGFVDRPREKPTIAAVNGLARGGGTELMLACDLVVLNEEATIGLPEVRRGLFAAAGGLIELPRHLPVKLAMELALTGATMDAATALRWGLANRVLPAGEVLAGARGLAGEISANAPLAVRVSRRLVRGAAGAGSPWDAELHDQQHRAIEELLASDDVREGATAFAEKRAPHWSGS